MSVSYCPSLLSVHCAEVIVVDTERGAGDLRELVRQVYWKDGTLLAEHDWLHDDPIYANCFLRSAAERGEWLPTKLRDQAGSKPDSAPVSADADQPEPVFAGADVQRDRISVSIAAHPAKADARLLISLSELGGWNVRAVHSFGGAFIGHFYTDAEVQKHVGDWLAELRAEAALGRHETQEESAARLAQSGRGVRC